MPCAAVWRAASIVHRERLARLAQSKAGHVPVALRHIAIVLARIAVQAPPRHMGSLSGIDLARILLTESAGLPIILTSGTSSLLAAIGRDCLRALQFIADGTGERIESTAIEGEVVDDAAIEKVLRNLVQAPLGLDRDDDFRISIAGAQEKTALLHYEGQWLKPRGTTPTMHLFKTQIRQLPNGIDLSNSVETEYYCLKLLAAFGLPVNNAAIQTFGKTTALVIERFDRRWTRGGRLLRVPQEDCYQALPIPPSRK